MEGSDPREKLASTYKEALTKNWMVWPVVQFTNFKFVPLEHRVLVVNVISLGKSCYMKSGIPQMLTLITGWNCYLSFLNSQPGGVKELPPDV